jgi:hypothetical protein
MRKFLILDSQLRHLAFHDLDQACASVQNMIGQTFGDVAGVCFSGFDWDAASIEERVTKLRDYVRVELRYLRAAN